MIAIEELLAEKLARYRHDSLAGDLYDLAWFSDHPFNGAPVRQLTVLKVWRDANKTGLGKAPFNPEDVLRRGRAPTSRKKRSATSPGPVEIDKWIADVQWRCALLRDVDDLEKAPLAASPRDSYIDTWIFAYNPIARP